VILSADRELVRPSFDDVVRCSPFGSGLPFSSPIKKSKPWSPLDLPNLALWLDAGNTGGTNGANLTTWTDLSGNGFHLNAQDAANVFHSSGGPNGKPYVAFTIGALYRAGPLLSGADAARTCYTVVRRGADGHVCWLDGRYGYNGWALAFGVATSGKRAVYCSGVAACDDTTNNATGNWEQIAIINTGASGQAMRVGGASHTLSPNNATCGASTTRFSVGGNDNGFAPDAFVGDIAELIITSAVLGSPDTTLVETYLTTKYGV
jgi:hypothetical protein